MLITLTLSTASGLGISLGTPACEGKSLQLVGMVIGSPSEEQVRIKNM